MVGDTSTSEAYTMTNTIVNADDYTYFVTPSDKSSIFVTKPLQFQIAIKDSAFSTAQLKHITINKRNGTAIIATATEIPNITKEPSLLNIGTWKMLVKKLDPKPKSVGVIGPIHTEESLTDLETYLIEARYPLHSLKRLYKRSGKEILPTMYIKVCFTDSDRPTDIKIGHIVFKVNDYHPNPVQCYKCQLFGHTATNCKGQDKCLYCSKRHAFKDCDKQAMKCANCGSLAHMANYGGCPKMKQAKEIEIISHTESITYSEAKNKYFASSSSTQQPAHASSTLNTHITQPISQSHSSTSHQSNERSMTYADIVTGKTSVTANGSVNIFNSSQFMLCLIIKCLGQTNDDSALQNILLDTVTSCNEQYGTTFNDQDIDSVLRLTKKTSLINMVEDTEDGIEDDSDIWYAEDKSSQNSNSQTSTQVKKRQRQGSGSPPQRKKIQ